jgi:hypothetical protein
MGYTLFFRGTDLVEQALITPLWLEGGERSSSQREIVGRALVKDATVRDNRSPQ